MKKILTTILAFILLLMVSGVTIVAATSLEPLKTSDGKGYVKYRNTLTQVMIPTTYTKPQADFRAVWVSPLVNDIGNYIDDNSFKAELLGVLDTIESMQMNAIIFHLRIMNDALYDSKLNRKSSYVSGVDFNKWDYLEWFIGEAHRRGIEFHAWLNPYRISASAITLDQVLSQYQNYKQNPASKAENVLIGNSGAILNPGEPAVRDFVVNTCMEIIEKYDVDAIHFDDYFYASMPANADQVTYNKYKKNSSTNNITDWRREQVDLFIKQLSDTMRAYNLEHNRSVQLGIAPTGVYRNGNGIVTYDANGTAITSGSNTSGQEHYSSYLFCDTKKWVDNEWIDYIVPQSYWSFELKAAPYADVVDWWAQVVKYKKVNLYTGMGLYRRYSGDDGGSWETNPMEAANQILYNTKHPEIKGSVIFNYRYLKQALNVAGMNKVVNEYWQNPALTPEVKTMNPIVPGTVSNIKIAKSAKEYVISWDKATNARKYAIYRSEGTVDINNPDQLVDVVGVNENGDNIFVDKINTTKNYNYAIVAVSGTNTTGVPTTVNTSNATTTVDFTIANQPQISISGKVFPDERIQIFFNDVMVFAGSNLTYELALSYDQSDWTVIKHENLRKSGIRYTYLFTYQTKPLYAKVTGYNEFGSVESETVVIQISISSLIDYFDFTNYLFNKRINELFQFD